MSVVYTVMFFSRLVSNSENMSDKVTTNAMISVEDTGDASAKADKFFGEHSDASFQRKLLKLQNMKFNRS
jgi:hypothetical protein